jgi:hypothetical protein
MTVINGIEIDDIEYNSSCTKQAIANNEPIDDVLHVVCVISNPAMFASRYILAKQFLYRLQFESNIRVYVVELSYGKQQYYITEANDPRHLQLRGEHVLWHKENMVNIGVKKLLPKHWKAMAWIDMDVEFENNTWALDTLKILNGHRDIVQLYSHCIDMDKDESAMNVFSSFGFQYEKKQKYCINAKNFWHPGYAWAISRKAYERIGGLYEYGILGSGDYIMALSIINNGLKGVTPLSTDDYKNTILEFQRKMKTLRLGYVPGVIRHFYHGKKSDRKYVERWRILSDNDYSPNLHITRNCDGLLTPSVKCPADVLVKIKEYFYQRNEDN